MKLLYGREKEMEGRTFPWRTLAGYASAVCLNDAVDNRQPHAGSLANLFGGTIPGQGFPDNLLAFDQ